MSCGVWGAQSMLSVLSYVLVFGCWGLSEDQSLIKLMTMFRPPRWTFWVVYFVHWESWMCQSPQFNHFGLKQIRFPSRFQACRWILYFGFYLKLLNGVPNIQSTFTLCEETLKIFFVMIVLLIEQNLSLKCLLLNSTITLSLQQLERIFIFPIHQS